MDGCNVTHMLAIGLGYTARAVAENLSVSGWMISGTARSADKVASLREHGVNAIRFDGSEDRIPDTLPPDTTHLLVSASPDENGDPVLRLLGPQILALRALQWIGYLSTVGVYGNHDGAWIGEAGELRATSRRAKRRVVAEEAWLSFGIAHRLPVHIFRLPGIYGPGRSALDRIRQGKARRIIKPGQVFNRAHVEDIARVLAASMARPNPGAIYNVADDEPGPPQDVMAYAAELLGVQPPEAIDFDDADLSPMARSFYGDNKRVSNALIKSELGIVLKFPTFREGLAHISRVAARNADRP